jgi:hypothetical protein
VVEHVLAKDETRVRFSLAAQNSVLYSNPCHIKILLKTPPICEVNVDNYVSNVYKGHDQKLFLNASFIQNMLKNKDVLIKDIKI